jgi:hypothetical protein
MKKTPLTPHFRIFSKGRPSRASSTHPHAGLQCPVFSLGPKSDQCYHHLSSSDVQSFVPGKTIKEKNTLGATNRL